MLQNKLYWPRRWITRKTKKKIYGRKIPLKTIVKNEIDRLEKAGVVRHTNYKYMTEEQVEQFCKLMSEPWDIENARDTLHQKEKEWMLKMWHDHSDILNHSYVSFMSCFLYDPINFLTDEKKIDVQSFIERPQLYIFGLSGKTMNNKY